MFARMQRGRALLGSLFLILAAGCSSSSATNDGGSNPGGASPGTGGAGGGAAGGAEAGGGTGPQLACSGILEETECSLCLEDTCCAQLAACNDDSDCYDCLIEGVTEACTGDIVEALSFCIDDECGDSCEDAPSLEFVFDSTAPAACDDVPVEAPSGGACADVDADLGDCNLVTNEGCAEGQACDLGEDEDSGATVTACFDGVSDEVLCAACDYEDESLWCAPGHYCLQPDEAPGQCVRYCCTDADCGSQGDCVDLVVAGEETIGVCLQAGSGGGGAGAGGDSSTGGGGGASAGGAAAGGAGGA